MANMRLKRMRQELVIAQADLAEARRAPWSLLGKSRILGIEASIERIQEEIETEKQRQKERAKK